MSGLIMQIKVNSPDTKLSHVDALNRSELIPLSNSVIIILSGGGESLKSGITHRNRAGIAQSI